MKKQNPLGLVVGILIFTVGMLALAKACQENRGQTREPADTNGFALTFVTNLVKFEGRPWTEYFPVQICEAGVVMFEITPLVTNRWTNIVRVLEEEPVATPCPECGGLDHHDRQVARMQVHERISSTVIYRGRTNPIVVWSGVVSNWIGTNLVMRQRRQPGWTVPPTPPVQPPPLTNAPKVGDILWLTNAPQTSAPLRTDDIPLPYKVIVTPDSHSTFIDHDPIGRTLVSAVEGGKLAAHEEWRRP